MGLWLDDSEMTPLDAVESDHAITLPFDYACLVAVFGSIELLPDRFGKFFRRQPERYLTHRLHNRLLTRRQSDSRGGPA